MLGADDCAQLLGEVREAASTQRQHLQQRVDVYAWHVAYGDGATWASELEKGGAGAIEGASQDNGSVAGDTAASSTANTSASANASTSSDDSSDTSTAITSSSNPVGDVNDIVSYVVNPEVESEAALRLRLLEHTCASLTRLFPSANPPSGVGSRTRDDAVAKWKAAVTAARVDHGVWVSIPALMHRARNVLGSVVPVLAPEALPLPPSTTPETSSSSSSAPASSSTEGTSPSAFEQTAGDEKSADIISSSSSSSSDPQLPRAVVLAVLRACLEGGYERRLEALASLFDHSCEPPEDDALNCALAEVLAKANANGTVGSAEGDDLDDRSTLTAPPALSWPEMEVVLRVGAEAAALALRDELLSFTAVNPVDPVHQVWEITGEINGEIHIFESSLLQNLCTYCPIYACP